MTAARLRILDCLVKTAFVIVCVPVLLTHLGIIACCDLAPQLPSDLDVAGPWAFYWHDMGGGWGTVGYNHAYTAAQILTLASLVMNFSRNDRPFRDACYLCLGLAATFGSESRAGLAAYVIYLAALGFTQFRLATRMGGILCVTVILLVACFPKVVDNSFFDLAERQETILDAQNTDNLSGRDEIWRDYGEFLAENPLYVLLGAGFGASFAITVISGGAHLLFLTIVVETGVVGLILFLASANQVLGVLFRHEGGNRAIAWATVCLLITCFTQETFYPVAAFGHLIGLHWFTVAMALRERTGARASAAAPHIAPLLARV
jgi:O-antigen ligase